MVEGGGVVLLLLVDHKIGGRCKSASATTPTGTPTGKSRRKNIRTAEKRETGSRQLTKQEEHAKYVLQYYYMMLNTVNNQ